MTKLRKIAFIFPGQGAQYPGMGKDFVEAFSIAKDTLQEADEILKIKLSSIILNGPAETLTETKNSQLGIFVVSMAILRVLQKNFPELKPETCAGLSLGEYTALCASERLGFKETLNLVKFRSQYMNDACQATQGGMSVILGLEVKDVEELVKKLNLPSDLWIANFNCPGQIVISGTKKGIEAATLEAKAKGAKRVLPLQVYGAFHSGLMAPAQERLKKHVEEIELHPSTISYVMNVPGDFVSDDAQIKDHLVSQVTHSVKWQQGLSAMANHGIELFLEIGCGKTLAPFVKRTTPEIPAISLEKISDLDSLAKAIDDTP